MNLALFLILVLYFSLLAFQVEYGSSLRMVEGGRSVEGPQHKEAAKADGDSLQP